MSNLNLPIFIIMKDTCIIRAVTKRDSMTKKRWFGYYGNSRNIKDFCNSKDFVKKYSVNGQYEYYKIIRSLPLLNIPYVNLYMYDEKMFLDGLNTGLSLINFVIENKDKLNVVKKFSLQRVINDILEVLIPSDEEDLIKDKNLLKKYQEIFQLKKSFPEYTSNPDYSFASLVCELGFLGWKRVASSDYVVKSDELFFCDIDFLENNYILKDDKCNLNPSC